MAPTMPAKNKTVYLLWRPILDIVLKSFPSKHNIAAFVGIEFNSTFVVKVGNTPKACFFITKF
jgi:hypothetical protein